jgi:hypothetical protein
MGIKGGPLKKLPGGDSCVRGLQKAGLARKRVNIDAAGLMYYCALRYETRFLANDYYPAVRAFQDEVVYLHFILQWDLVVVFDGKDPAWKGVEHDRHYGDDFVDDGGVKTKIRNNGTYIALCAKTCACLKIPYVVSTLEADTQVVKWRRDENPIIVTGDSDILAYDTTVTVILISSWSMDSEEFRIYDIATVNESQWDGDETKRSKLKSKIMFSIARPAVATFFALNQQANAAQYRDPAPWESSNKEK